MTSCWGKSYFFRPRRLLHVADCAITAVAVLDAVFSFWATSTFCSGSSSSSASGASGFKRQGLCGLCAGGRGARGHKLPARAGSRALRAYTTLMATKFIGGAEFATDTIVRERYGDLTKSLSTLFQLCTFQMTWSESVGHVLRRSSYVTAYAWVVHGGILVFAYLWFVVVMGGVFKALQDEKRAEEEAEGARRQQSGTRR